VAITAMNHFTVLSSDLDATKDFYIRVLALAQGPRPDLGFPGAWLYAGGTAVLHIVAGRPVPGSRQGVIDHVAFSARDLPGTVQRLRAAGISYDLGRQPGAGIWQLFCFDPDGARIELDFDASEPAPAP
jgi:catechol 2,3-dioxygenase-like lactoylglutathione lyase family enzyme